MSKRSNARRVESFQEKTAQLRGIRNSKDMEDMLDEWDDQDFIDEEKDDYRFTKD